MTRSKDDVEPLGPGPNLLLIRHPSTALDVRNIVMRVATSLGTSVWEAGGHAREVETRVRTVGPAFHMLLNAPQWSALAAQLSELESTRAVVFAAMCEGCWAYWVYDAGHLTDRHCSRPEKLAAELGLGVVVEKDWAGHAATLSEVLQCGRRVLEPYLAANAKGRISRRDRYGLDSEWAYLEMLERSHLKGIVAIHWGEYFQTAEPAVPPFYWNPLEAGPSRMSAERPCAMSTFSAKRVRCKKCPV